MNIQYGGGVVTPTRHCASSHVLACSRVTRLGRRDFSIPIPVAWRGRLSCTKQNTTPKTPPPRVETTPSVVCRGRSCPKPSPSLSQFVATLLDYLSPIIPPNPSPLGIFFEHRAAFLFNTTDSWDLSRRILARLNLQDVAKSHGRAATHHTCDRHRLCASR